MNGGWGDYLAQTSQVRLVLQLFRRYGLAISANPNEEAKGAFGVLRMHDWPGVLQPRVRSETGQLYVMTTVARASVPLLGLSW